MIKKEEVQRIAKLARLGLKESEVKKFQKELSRILDYFDLLKKADTFKTEPSFFGKEKLTVMREDKAEPENLKIRDKLIEAAPDKKERHFKVKAVF